MDKLNPWHFLRGDDWLKVLGEDHWLKQQIDMVLGKSFLRRPPCTYGRPECDICDYARETREAVDGRLSAGRRKGVRLMQRPFELPTCLTNFSREEKRALDKVLDGRVQQFVEGCVEHAKKKAQSEGRELSTQQEARIRKSWKNWREKVGDVVLTTLRSRGDTGRK